MPTTDVEICNGALYRIGADAIVALADANDRARLCTQFYAPTRDATLELYPWNFAIVRATLLAYTEPAATLTPGAGATTAGTTGVTFTASAGVFVAGDVGKVIQGNGGPGKATITGFTGPTIVTATITIAFASLAAIAAGAWRLYNAPPAWGFSQRILLPSDCLRIWTIDGFAPTGLVSDAGSVFPTGPLTAPESTSIAFKVEGPAIVSDAEAVNLRYISRVTTVSLFPARFVEALELHLASKLVHPLRVSASTVELVMKLYSLTLRTSRFVDGQEGTREVHVSRPLIDVRR